MGAAFACSLLALTFLQAYTLYYVFTYGPLQGAVPYDDCGVILRALQNLDRLAGAGTLGHFFSNARQLTIHAPISDLQTMAGLLFSGGAAWGPYALNATWPAIALFSFFLTMREQPLFYFIIPSAFLLLSPLTLNGLWWLKSDWQGGVLLVAAIVVLFDAAERATRTGKIVGSFLLGLVLLTKMTAFYQPVPVFGVFFAFELYEFLRRKQVSRPEPIQAAVVQFSRDRLSLWGLCALLILGPYLFFFYQSREHLFSYIQWGLSPIWEDKLTLGERIAYYLPVASKSLDAWGALHLQFSIFLLAAAPALWWQREKVWVLPILGAMIVAFFLPLTMASTSGTSYAAPALGVVAGSALIFARIIQSVFQRWGAWIALVVILALAPSTPLSFTSRNVVHGEPVKGDQVRALHRIQTEISADIAKLHRGSPPRVIYTFDDVLAPVTNLAIHYFRETGKFADVGRIDDLNLKDKNALEAASFVLTLVPLSPDQRISRLSPRWPISVRPETADQWLRGSSRFQLAKTYATGDGEIRLYRSGN